MTIYILPAIEEWRKRSRSTDFKEKKKEGADILEITIIHGAINEPRKYRKAVFPFTDPREYRPTHTKGLPLLLWGTAQIAAHSSSSESRRKVL